jgi:hypothetical protein
VFVPTPFPIAVIPTRRNVPTTAQFLTALLNGYFGVVAPHVFATWHRYDGPRTIDVLSDCESEGEARAVLMFFGLSLLEFNLQVMELGLLQPAAASGSGGQSGTPIPSPIRIGPPQQTFAPPLFAPEPAGAGAFVATVALTALARRARRTVVPLRIRRSQETKGESSR